ncbi:glutamate racemase [Alicyclobacillaceae bacterium I2511]|nr:glutamate racemase [Alicyclobacillaceae bacterium I2511]
MTLVRNLPIGVMDSGIGGLTVVAEMRKRLPDERILYFGDTARCPYGDRSMSEVQTFSIEVCDFLYNQGVKMLVVACNTATSAALPLLQARYDVPVIGVIEPGARAAVAAQESHHVGVIGTSLTVHSGAYQRAVQDSNPNLTVSSLACPDFVPLVEAGLWEGNVAYQTVAENLAPMRGLGVDTLILGCTHYPHLQKLILQVMGPQVRLISSAEETAMEVKQLLHRTERWRLVAGNTKYTERDMFFTTGSAQRMTEALQKWLQLNVEDGQVLSVLIDSLGIGTESAESV